MNRWQNVKLEKVLDFYNGKEINYSNKGKYPVYGSNGVIGFYADYNFDKGIIIGRVGAYCGSININVSRFWSSDNTIVVLSKAGNFIEYLYYMLQTMKLNNYAGGSAQPLLTQKVLKGLKVKLPNLETQKKIADVLSTYDELIENNNRRIEILEKTAEEIYKEWFVRMRFPGYENTKFEKGVPEGWEVRKVGELVNRLQAGHFYKEEELVEEGKVIVIDQSEKEYMGFHNNKPTHISSIEDPIILFGDHSCKMLIMMKDFSLAENVIPFISKLDSPTIFLFYSLKGLIKTEEYKRHWKELINKKIFFPVIELQEKFRDTIKNSIVMIEEYKKQNQNLTKQRDLLLPRLMNGTIEVN